ncbi:BMC domain-containing protein [Desulforamulus aquiferis]|uniref:BMC domain-containing protein n=1 Tax=Desulforamulus aquiferis TaxID=1397668 RepID=A0AAW7ZDY9_9FIRM|nr:BMC domain-containing protein [Desulforamulus aquiferis]MDO7787715.1 BMC domain-containing protein [Desulforamulus aquiferis]
MFRSIGLVEFNSIAKGIEAADAMVKSAQVELIQSRSICPGKYIALLTGDVSAVESAVQQGVLVGEATVVDEFILPNVHPSVITAISATSEVEDLRALGVIEVFSVATAIVTADTAAKAADVDLIEIRLGIGIGGKSFITMTGDVAAVKAAVDAGVVIASEKGMLVEKVIIPSAHKELTQWIL